MLVFPRLPGVQTEDGLAEEEEGEEGCSTWAHLDGCAGRGRGRPGLLSKTGLDSLTDDLSIA